MRPSRSNDQSAGLSEHLVRALSFLAIVTLLILPTIFAYRVFSTTRINVHHMPKTPIVGIVFALLTVAQAIITYMATRRLNQYAYGHILMQIPFAPHWIPAHHRPPQNPVNRILHEGYSCTRIFLTACVLDFVLHALANAGIMNAPVHHASIILCVFLVAYIPCTTQYTVTHLWRIALKSRHRTPPA